MRLYIYSDVKIAVRTAANTGFTLAAHSKRLAVVYAGGNCNVYAVALVHAAAALAMRTGIAYYLARAVARFACAHGRERAEHRVLLHANLARTAAGGAFGGRGAGLCARAAAFRAVFFTRNQRRFLKGERKVIFQIVAANGAVARLLTRAAETAKSTAEYAVKNVAVIAKAARAVSAVSARTRSRIECCMTKLVIFSTLFFIG